MIMLEEQIDTGDLEPEGGGAGDRDPLDLGIERVGLTITARARSTPAIMSIRSRKLPGS